jgi:hypothetical protein
LGTREERRDVGLLLAVVGVAFLVGVACVKVYAGPLLFLALVCLAAGIIVYKEPVQQRTSQ